MKVYKEMNWTGMCQAQKQHCLVAQLQIFAVADVGRNRDLLLQQIIIISVLFSLLSIGRIVAVIKARKYLALSPHSSGL